MDSQQKQHADLRAQLIARYNALQPFAQALLKHMPCNEGAIVGHHGIESMLYFRGAKLVEFIKEDKENVVKTSTYLKPGQTIDDLCVEMLRLGLFARAMRVTEEDSAPRTSSNSGAIGTGVTSSRTKGKRNREGQRVFRFADEGEPEARRFDVGEKDRYIWRVEESSAYGGLMLTLVVLLVLAMCLHSVWPPFVRTIIWYISVTFLIALVAASVLQLVVFALCWLVGWEVWILPNLWGDGNPLLPVYTVAKATTSAIWSRILLVCCFAALMVWAYQQPSEVQAFFDTQKQMVEDLYSGKLLADATSGDNMAPAVSGPGVGWGKWGPGSYRYGGRPMSIPKMEDIEKLVVDDEEGGDGKNSKNDAGKEEEGGSTTKSTQNDEGDATNKAGEGSSKTQGNSDSSESGSSSDEQPNMDAMVDEVHQEQQLEEGGEGNEL